jgi:uncharacterized protein
LILRGARQVGKTTLITEFGKTYKQFILLNLEKEDDLYFFEKFSDTKTIIEALFLRNEMSYNSLSETLLFIDEIQESSKAIQFLRYFYEELPELHIISAGSLLEFEMTKIQNFPVGRVEFLYLHPMNFEEYLEANNKLHAINELNKIPIQVQSHKILLDLFNRYAIIGGMPEVIKVEVESKLITNLSKIYESLWATYQNDVEKYADNEIERKVIRHILKTASILIDKRIKFQNFGNSNYQSREVREAFRILENASIIQLIYPSTDTKPPLLDDIKKSPKLQFLDTGILNYTLQIQSDMLGIKDLNETYKGAIIPHMITQELISINALNKDKPRFWVREKKQSSAEVDLLFRYKNLIIPIEIKSGATGSLRSLHQFIDIAEHHYAVRIYGGEFKLEKTKTPTGKPYLLMNLPYFLGTKIPDYINWFVENYPISNLELNQN